MSNQVMIVPTKFQNPNDANDCDLGVRISDSYGSTFTDHWQDMPKDPMEILRRVLESKDEDEVISGMLDHVEEMEKGLCIGQIFYEWDEIKGVFAEFS